MPRVAYFPDSFHEVNGVAHTSRNLVAYAERRQLPLLCVRAVVRPDAVQQCGSVRTLELPRSAASVGVEKDLAFDPIFWRHADLIEEELRRFEPDVIHLTGPSELGIFAAYFAWKLHLPLAASWHTNVHEYAARRLTWLTKLIPGGLGQAAGRGVERTTFDIAMRFYSRAQMLFAPNQQLCDLIAQCTGQRCDLMKRGVDTSVFSPVHRTLAPRSASSKDAFILGYVGRLSVEKNVALLPRIQLALDAAGVPARFLIVGHGSEEEALRQALPTAEFAGVLGGAELCRAYANMDLFVFPSHTDTFGNVVLEALASGVPAVVTPDGGPRFIVREGETGSIAADEEFALAIACTLGDPARLARMRTDARAYALTCCWDEVFDGVYEAYGRLAARRAHLPGRAAGAPRRTPREREA